ncbi:hypothetical protein S83_013881 [Arachis hypogaea]
MTAASSSSAATATLPLLGTIASSPCFISQIPTLPLFQTPFIKHIETQDLNSMIAQVCMNIENQTEALPTSKTNSSRLAPKPHFRVERRTQ